MRQHKKWMKMVSFYIFICQKDWSPTIMMEKIEGSDKEMVQSKQQAAGYSTSNKEPKGEWEAIYDGEEHASVTNNYTSPKKTKKKNVN